MDAAIAHLFQYMEELARADPVAKLDRFGRCRLIVLKLDAQCDAEAAELACR